MVDFTPITTQEEFDKAVQARVLREQETLGKKYADYDQVKARNAELEAEVGALQATIEETSTSAKTHEQTLADLNAKIAGYETANLRTRIALQNGLPFDLADRLVGTDEDSIKADAERLAAFVGKQTTPPPLKNAEPPIGEGKDAAYKSLLENLNLEGE
ncbi:capsid assembly scaffolding protein Gp46 family protein [Trichococcus flocculiformis]|uniref:capsid assembly scaffolding protein Gp46 family protein n=1 Tax=Trichococcus flocculiformis TaxID=82803 RepID=UPI003DA1F812